MSTPEKCLGIGSGRIQTDEDIYVPAYQAARRCTFGSNQPNNGIRLSAGAYVLDLQFTSPQGDKPTRLHRCA